MSGNARELLETVCDTAAGMTHAAYPSASHTLCGVPIDDAVKPMPGFGAPVCALCAVTARTFRHVDQSVPPEWFLPLEATA